MKKISRREFSSLSLTAAALSLSAGLPRPLLAQGRTRVVIVGGGPGGATVATRLKSTDPNLEVTLIEPKDKYTTCFQSNLYLGGFRSFASITQDYETIKKLGIRVINDMAVAIDVTLKTVSIAKSSTPLSYDRLVVAPGIDLKFETIEGYSAEAAETMPHAWQAGPQTWLLKEKLLAMSDGGVVVMTVPANPYRCPPGPYERACMIGHFIKTRKPKSKLIIFDAKTSFSKQPVFEEAFAEYYKDIIELNLTNEIDDYNAVKVDIRSGEVTTKSGHKVIAAVANIIPAQRAGGIAAKAGLTEGDWCPVNPANFTSTKAKDVYVLGDAAIAAEMPKSAFAANNQAVVVAADILNDLAGKERVTGSYRNVCWSMLAPENSVKIGADYAPAEKDGKPILRASGAFVSATGESPAFRRDAYNESLGWYTTLVTEVFGRPPLSAEVEQPDAGSARKP